MAVPPVSGLPAGRYAVDSVLGTGSMGRVWKARDTTLDRLVAIKEMTLPPGLSAVEREQMRTRFLQEARAIARIDHPNVVRVHDVIDAGDNPLIVMEYVDGSSLQQGLKAGPIPAADTASIGSGVLAALRAAHRQGVLHRDVKPANILVDGDRRVVLTDFGIAKVAGYQDISHSGLIVGTAAYVAPERVLGRPPSPAADLWSLGVTLYACLYGGSPFTRPEEVATLYAVVHDDVTVPAGPLGPLLEGLLEKDPARRANAEQAERMLAEARHSLAPGRAAGPAPVSASASASAPASASASATLSRRFLVGVLTTAVLAVAAAGAVVWQNRAGGGEPADSAATTFPPASAAAPSPTHHDDEACVRDGSGSLPYLCPVAWGPEANGVRRIPVYAEPADGTPIASLLITSGMQQRFRCQQRGERFEYRDDENFWWAFTQADEPAVEGWVPEVYLRGGLDNEPDGGLPLC